MFRRGTNLFTKITSKNLYYKDVKKMSQETDYEPYSKMYDNERSAAGSGVICAFLQFYTGIELQRMKVLDAGCGTGTITKALVEHGIGNISMVDASAGMLEVAKVKLADDIKSGVVNSIVQAHLPPIPFPDASFDAVMFNMVFVHIDESIDALEHVWTLNEARRVLEPGGVVLISSIVRSTAINMWPTKIYKSLGERYVSKVLSLQRFEEMIHEAGLSCEQKINVLGSDMFPNYFKNPRSYLKAYMYFLNATNDERQRVDQAVNDLEQRGELQQWIAEHDNITGLLTILVCRANANCSS